MLTNINVYELIIEVNKMKKEERRKQILDAAMTIFVEKGFKGSTTIEIAKAAEISEVTLFRYFSSKQEIFLEGIEPIFIQTLEGSINTSKDLKIEEKLVFILTERIRLISKNYKVVRLILAEESLLEKWGREGFMNRILSIFKQLLKQMGILEQHEDFILRLIMGSMLSFLYIPEENEGQVNQYVNKVVMLIVNEIKK